MMIPNVIWHYSIGKFVFVAVDGGIVYLLWNILRLRGVRPNDIVKSLLVFLFHPLAANVTTRGSADGIVTFLVLIVVYCLLKKRVWLAAIW